MGAIKVKSDSVIINNDKELITPAIVREVNDVIDVQVEEAKTSISTLTTNLATTNTNLATTNTTLNTLNTTVTTIGNIIPNGGTTGQVLVKKTNADKDTEWIDAASGGSSLPSGGTEGQILAKTTLGQEWQTAPFLPLSGGTVIGLVSFDGQYAGINFHSEQTGTTWISGNTLGGFRYIAPNDDFDVNFDFLEGIYHHYQNKALSYSGDYSANFTARSLVDKAYVHSILDSIESVPDGGGVGQVLTKMDTGSSQWQDAPTTNISGLLKTDGSNAATDNLNFGDYGVENVGYISGYGCYLSFAEKILDLGEEGVLSYANAPLVTDSNHIPNKAYVDSKTTKAFKGTFVTGNGGQLGKSETIDVEHGLESYDLQVAIFLDDNGEYISIGIGEDASGSNRGVKVKQSGSDTVCQITDLPINSTFRVIITAY